jgi:hypothetical protein
MDNNEIARVAAIMLTADRFCSGCQEELTEKLSAVFPEHDDTIRTVFREREFIRARFEEIFPGDTPGEPPMSADLLDLLIGCAMLDRVTVRAGAKPTPFAEIKKNLTDLRIQRFDPAGFRKKK